VLDYIFRELAVSYLGRHDLAHVDPREIVGETGLGSSDQETDETLDLELPDSVSKVVSKGFMRGNKLRLATGGRAQNESAAALRDLTSFPAVEGETAVYPMTDGATALKADGEVMYSRLTVTRAEVSVKSRDADRRLEARIRGYEGEDCRECGNFTLVRNGTCLKCDTCGGTSGCS
jgi:ribonucleoside-diphosphate reductase alpha chain